MGLGKTIEIIALILGNPFREAPQSFDENHEVIKATLIVVPPTLLSQWFDEFKNRIRGMNTGETSFTVIRSDALSPTSSFLTDINYLRRPGYDVDGVACPPSNWGFEYDGVTPLSLKRGEVMDYKVQHVLGMKTFKVQVKYDCLFPRSKYIRPLFF